ncbi:hypothetical protein PC112_g6273 [Phytophthora cactorum]|nr:hypothetical protein PC112_g6273 [Phytophthora cactorum]
MKRRATQLTNECASLITTARSRQHSFNVVDFRGDMESFRGLFRRLDDAYQTMDAVFMENEATWKHFKGVEKHLANGSLYEKAEKGLDEPYTIIADFKKELYANSSRADIKTQRAKEKSEKKKQKKESETALVADNLRGLMQRRATQLTNECSSLMTLARSKHHHVVDVLPLRGDIGDFEGLFQRLEDSYRMLDDVFMANGLAGMTTSPVDVHPRGITLKVSRSILATEVCTRKRKRVSTIRTRLSQT